MSIKLNKSGLLVFFTLRSVWNAIKKGVRRSLFGKKNGLREFYVVVWRNETLIHFVRVFIFFREGPIQLFHKQDLRRSCLSKTT